MGATDERSWPEGAADVLRRAGRLGRDLAAVDWAATPLGPPGTWPQSLVGAVRIMLGSRFAMWMAWGPELTFLCNDAYRRDTLGLKYPWALGRPAADVWAEIWGDVGPRIESVLRSGEATWDQALLLFLERSGYREETYHTFSYSPLADEAGRVVGMLCVVAEETERVVGERRLATLNRLAASLSPAQGEAGVLAALEAGLADAARDVPFALAYLLDAGGTTARLAAAVGMPAGHVAAPAVVDVVDPLAPWPIARAIAGETVRSAIPGGASLPAGPFGASPTHAVTVPLAAPAYPDPSGVLVVGLTPHRPADAGYTSFSELVAGQLAGALASARAYESERERAEQLAELDRAKTTFFTNISHEFRTPLTLMLGPLRDALDAEGTLDAAQEARVRLAFRNGNRLLTLVNTLLDFSAQEAGRLQVALEPIDLAGETAQLASMFRSAIEEGGVRLAVDCPPLDQPVAVDRRMWEQIVTNLVSNAFKHTFAGTIEVALAPSADGVELVVRDTGEGIPASEVPLVFDRFHTVRGARSRSVEGSGIGLALVRELVELHHGTIALDSTPGVGTTVRVVVPVGLVAPAATPGARRAGPLRDAASARAAEAEAWVSGAEADSEAYAGDEREQDFDGSRVLVVDDNADMRAYLVRLLRRRFRVRTASSGAEALESVAEEVPDLVLSDVMMPEIDGYELLARLRATRGLADVPVILLSARAGPEAAVEGLGLGADDYLVKPFTAEELFGRVGARVAAGRQRRQRQLLTRTSAQLASATSPQEVVAAVHAAIGLHLGTANASLATVDRAASLVRFWHAVAYPGGIDARYHVAPLDAAGVTFTAIRDGVAVALESRDAIAARFPERLVDFDASGIGASLTVPLVRATGEIVGSLTVGWAAPRRLLAPERDLVERVATLVVDALERIRVLALERELVEELQANLLAVDRRAPTLTAAVRYRPAEHALLLGGDWYDILTLDDDVVGISVGDVVGHGLPAATVMSQLRSAVGAATTLEAAPARVVERVDAYARRLPDAVGTTLAYLLLAPDGELRWCCAGHLPPLLLAAGEPAFLEGRHHRPLAVPAADGPTPEGRVQLDECALVVVYTDGLVERRGEVIDVGLARLAAAVDAHRHLPVDELCDAVLREMAPPHGFRDDVALVALRRTGATRGHFVDAVHATPPGLAVVRGRLRAWLATTGLGERRANDALIATCEAVANAIEHGSARAPDRVVTVEASVRDGELLVAVGDGGRWVEDSTRGPSLGRGRGFAIMEALMDEVAVRRDRLGTTVLLTGRPGAPGPT